MTVRSKNIYLSNKTPLAMQYLGGKGRIVNEILEGIKSNFGVLPSFIDLFAGSGVVSYYAQQRGYTVFANDIQPYSSTVLNSLLKCSTAGIDDIINILNKVKDKQLFSNFRESFFDDYLSEK